MNDNYPLPSNLNLAFVEGLYTEYLRDPSSVTAEWQQYFKQIANGDYVKSYVRPGPSFEAASIFNPATERRFEVDVAQPREEGRANTLQDRVSQLIRAYRVRGHVIAQIDPLGIPRPTPPELDASFYGFSEADEDRRFSCETLAADGTLTLREILDRLRNTYCRTIGVEYMHIDDRSVRRWLQERMEQTENRHQISRKEQLRILTRLTDAVVFEEFIHKKFVGAKSFSLEGCESLIPLLDLAIEKAADQGVEEIVFGMAHRGRLNVLANIMGKSASEIFREFADADPELYTGRGDVKYHKGYSGDWKTTSKRTVHLSLCFNPSHLEFVNPVAMGRVRAKQDRVGDKDHARGLTVLIHGDAAFAGEGVVQETLNLSELSGYSVGGALHIIVNNQIGFTTSPHEGRSCTYATDVAKMLQIPIFHVNGEDPEAVAQVVRLALEFRQNFRRDVVIDMYGYRRLGHNEADEPSFTQPLLYKAIEKRKPVREGYLDYLLKLGGITKKDADRIAESRQELFEKELTESRTPNYKAPIPLTRKTWEPYVGGLEKGVPDVDTGVEKARLSQILESQTKLPADFHPHPKIERFLQTRAKMASGEQGLDWSAGEALAFGSIATEGFRIRMSGQDACRGTFSHRHAVLYDYEDGHPYTPLRHLDPKQASVEIFNSPLSEVAVLGFEYGYSLDTPNGLVLWEAQFGDFWNAAQVIVDQFIASAEEKWKRLNGVVMLLPHGFEGQGPEHSSARLERFLQLAANDNMQITYPSTPAQYFHLLRRQVVRPWRKPLIVMTPKSLLRQPDVISSLDECATGRFQRILSDPTDPTPNQVRRIILCTGKIYYELHKAREAANHVDIAIIRLEQLFPLDQERLRTELDRYPKDVPVYWVQEEPENMGTWHYLRAIFGESMFERRLMRISRPAASSPATGSANSHKLEQQQILKRALETPAARNS
jgi:2-oxoglutarate dehydrogenase E1 component